MASRLSPEKIQKYRDMLKKAEPYPDNAPEINTLDRAIEGDDRVWATIAKKILEMDGVLPEE